MNGWTAERWSRVSPYLDEALELEPSARLAWLRELAASKPDVAEDLRVLLARHEANTAAQFLEHSPAGVTPETQAGEQIGAYTLEILLGRGGMGTVWLARRSDGHFEGQVAIKILDRRALGANPLEQIRHEAGLLAQLSHANIARLLDAGVRENGEPFLILEYVDGQRIDAYCRERLLDAPARLRLLLPVLDAVAHAHAHNIVHRDLKPTNILVTTDGSAKLLDFGVASLQRAESISDSSMLQPLGMTPGYASPEQIRGYDVTAGSDVYALGVLLYVLMTGRHPHGGESSTPTKLIRATLTEDSPTASALMNSAEARKWVRGDLDAIIAKATHRAAAHRYETAAELAADVRRFLSGHPIRARKLTVLYRTSSLARRLWGSAAVTTRERWAMRAATLSVTVLVAAILTLSWRFTTISSSERHEKVFAPPLHSVAVLPFKNESGDAGQEYFSDGMTDEILNALSRVDDLLVSARMSAFHFKGTDTDIGTIGRTLNVAAVLEGSIRRSDKTIRVTARLIDTVKGLQMWSQSYERDSKDILAIQTEIATAVSIALQSKLLGGLSNIDVGGTHNGQAHDEFLRAYYLDTLPGRKEEDIRAALAHYEKAIALDPGYALAYANRVADLYYSSWVFEATPKPELANAARESAERAVALAPTLLEAHIARAFVLYRMDFDFAGAASEYERLLALGPGSARARKNIAEFFGTIGRCDEAIVSGRQAVRLDPLDTSGYMVLAGAFDCGRRFAEELTVFRSLEQLNPHSYMLGIYKGLAYLALGQPELALSSCQGDTSADVAGEQQRCLAIAYHRLNKPDEGRRELEKLQAQQHDAGAYQYASIFSQWEDRKSALQWLATAERLHDPYLPGLKIDWTLDPIRDTVEFQGIQARLKYPD